MIDFGVYYSRSGRANCIVYGREEKSGADYVAYKYLNYNNAWEYRRAALEVFFGMYSSVEIDATIKELIEKLEL